MSADASDQPASVVAARRPRGGRRWSIGIGLGLIVVSVGLRQLVDPVVRAVYDGWGPARVREIITGRDVHHVDFYQDMAHELVRWPFLAVLGVGVVLLATGLAQLVASRTVGPSRDPVLLEQRIQLAGVTIVLAGVIVVIALYADTVGTRQPVISEIATSNASLLADDTGDHPDWIELHNRTDEPVDLGGWFLSDDDAQPDRWEFPEISIPAGDYLVVFASGADRNEPSQELHTDFRLAQSGEPVLLVAPDGQTIVDRLPPTEVPRDASFGRDPSDPSRTCFFAFPTPGEPNVDECFDHPDLGVPTFTAPSGFHPEPFDLEIVADDPDSEIIYTLDGSYPDREANPERTKIYAGPLRIADRSDEPDDLSLRQTDFQGRTVENRSEEPVQKGTVVRARTTYGAERVATYFVGDHLVRSELPVLSLALDEEYLFDHDTGIYVPGRIYEEFRDSEAFDPDLAWRSPANYHQRGREWERPFQDDLRRAVVFEHCAPGARVCDHQQAVGVRLHGNFSRSLPQKSLRLYARNDYGERTLSYPFFGEEGPRDHRRLLLRNSGNDARNLMFLDGYLQSLMTDFAADTQAYQPATLFINGEYWGIHNLRERYDRHYLATVHGADPDRVVILDTAFDVEAGDPDGDEPFRELLELIVEGDVSNPAAVERIEAEIDLDSFFDFVIAHVAVGNWDWPRNNVRLWREVDGPDRPGASTRDGRWRWLVFDLDLMGGNLGQYDADYDVFTERFAPPVDDDQPPGYAAMFHRLMDNDALRDRFLARYADRLNTTFDPAITVGQLDDLEGLLEEEIVLHRARWGELASGESWHDEVDRLRTFMQQRPARLRDHAVDLFGLEGNAALRVAHDGDRGTVQVNTHDVANADTEIGHSTDWHGTFFLGVPVRLEAMPEEGYRFVRWEGLTGPAARHATLDVALDGPTRVRAVFEPE